MLLGAALLALACVAPPPSNPGQPQCLMSSNGTQACGYNCRLGADGQAACANSPDGICALGSDGRVTCSQVAGGGHPGGAPPPECRMSSDGTNVCGYNCMHSSGGQVSCASRPDGHCAFNSDGTLSCP
jgi:hypothetical protein